MKISRLNGLYNDLAKKETFIVARNHICKEIDGVNFVQSSLKSHPLWVTLIKEKNYTILEWERNKNNS